ncbi:MAG: CBS domain-containing protein, partial [Anaerolineales bacterium]|nr:CBS domain-containing protein [Anaerolineales bacterium]
HARRVDLEGRTCRDTTVGEVMTTEVVTVTPEQSIDECMGLMTERRIRHLPVTEEDEIIGVISIGDVVKEVIAEQEFRIEQLQNYISGDR